MYIVVVGNPVDGLSFHGPFDSYELALVWAENLDEQWLVNELTNPEEEETLSKERKLAEYVVDAWDMDTLTSYAVDNLEQFYLANQEKFVEDLKDSAAFNLDITL